MTEAERRAKYKYREKGKRILIDLYPSEQSIIDWLDKKPKKATYIKELIKNDMSK